MVGQLRVIKLPLLPLISRCVSNHILCRLCSLSPPPLASCDHSRRRKGADPRRESSDMLTYHLVKSSIAILNCPGMKDTQWSITRFKFKKKKKRLVCFPKYASFSSFTSPRGIKERPHGANMTSDSGWTYSSSHSRHTACLCSLTSPHEEQVWSDLFWRCCCINCHVVAASATHGRGVYLSRFALSAIY